MKNTRALVERVSVKIRRRFGVWSAFVEFCAATTFGYHE